MSKRILIVEDEESIADLEKDYLELSGFEVEVANDGETGLRRGLAVEFDLIILDLMLRELTDLKSAVRSGGRKILQLLWFQRRKMILTRSVDWDLVRMII